MKYIWRKIKRFKPRSPCGWHNGGACTQMCISGAPITQNGLPQRDNPVTEGTTLRFCASHATNIFYGTSIRAHACSWPSLAAIAGPNVLVEKKEARPICLQVSPLHCLTVLAITALFSARLAFQSLNPFKWSSVTAVLIH